MSEKSKIKPSSYTFKLLKANDVVRDSNGLVMDESQPEYPPYVSISNPCIVNFQGNSRKMRYIEGFKSVWVDEQPEEIEANLINSINNVLIFANGTITINDWEKCKLEYITNHPSHSKSLYKTSRIAPLYELTDESVAALQELDLQDLRFDAMSKARAVKDDEMLAHAKALGIQFTETDGQLSRDMSAIRRDYRVFAEKNPKAFLETYEDPKTKITYWVKKAIDENMIDLASVPGQAKWSSTKGLITVIPEDKDPIEYLTNLTYVDAGAELKKRLIKAYDK